ncbi:MAG: isoprenylcysteine carboxylmethyltransferase family protein [Acidobacteria bacterium]|nr:MAG: isoprenylcysteine carboxylmethyltransferase family protein [Acidobacteriota bacterium]
MARLYVALLAAWWAGEALLALFRRAAAEESRGRDRGSMAILFVTNVISTVAAVALGARRILPIGAPPADLLGAAVLLLLSGVGIRVWAILTLGRLFTMNVAIRRGHRIVARGPYRAVRHPSYTGLLLAFTSVGLALRSWASLLVLLVPVSAATLYRIRVEERALADAFGAAYEEYARGRFRLFPFLY